MYSMGELQIADLEKAGYHAKYMIPKEGAMGWVDTWAMSKGVKNKDLAHAWVNFFLSKEISESMTAKHRYGNTVSLFRRAETGPLDCEHVCTAPLGDRCRAIGGMTIRDDDFICKGN